ncbi:hypothetical protein BDQ12DRAFT_183272 [Crucibulum laeve]|uniref:PUA-like domain-containing protein n=1 Tax=Crucibulum laeve TaxID=68775 RepID=A0A5C3MQK0_9AGAR|nr:hypothetical protein BDQ12DRAFT_183272 [Crucibulum laeve]
MSTGSSSSLSNTDPCPPSPTATASGSTGGIPCNTPLVQPTQVHESPSPADAGRASASHRVQLSDSHSPNLTSQSRSMNTLPPEPSSDAAASAHPSLPPSNTTLPSSTPCVPMPSTPLQPSDIRPALVCPHCLSRLNAPTTLHCGHTICAHHVSSSSSPTSDPNSPLPACPIPSCSTVRSSAQLPRIPPHSRVQYRPAPPPQHEDPPAPQMSLAEPKLDVTVNKILSLVSRTQQALQDDENRAGFIPQPSGNHSDDNDSDQGSSSSHSRRDSSHRPRKRRRRHSPQPEPDDGDWSDDLLSHLRRQATHNRDTRDDEPLSTHGAPPVRHDRAAILTRFEKDFLTELTCEICFVLLYQPITTPCQHTFCAKCLHRSLDHSSNCPVCRQNLPGFSYFQDHPMNKIILSLILQTFPTIYKERGDAIEQEERDARLDTPIFVCQLSFPGMPTLLHFFEPRYRLMLRRCLESPNPRFGMIMPPKTTTPSAQIDYGTMLEIKSVQMLPDGRSVVETWGAFRFRILERGTLDGYMVGRIERIDDYPEDITEPLVENGHSSPEDNSVATFLRDALEEASHVLTRPSAAPTSSSSSSSSSQLRFVPSQPSNEELMDTCKAFLDRLQRGTAPWVVQRLSSTYGSMPTEASAFSFWVALVLPIEEHEKSKLLPLRSPRLRLLLVVHWIEQLNNNWYAWLLFVLRDGWMLDGPAGPIAICIALVLMAFRFLFRWI